MRKQFDFMRPIFSALVVQATIGSAFGQCADIPPNPAEDGLGAAFGSAVVISADGSVALVGGSGFDLGDGIVRTFTRAADQWTEGLAIPPHQFTGGTFGWSIAMSDDGNSAVITAPREHVFSPSFFFAAGAAHLYVRDPGSGAWSSVQRWQSPTPGGEYNFGASCDMSADGSVVVVGETNVLGSLWQHLPDAAWVMTLDAGTWSDPQPLVPTSPVDAALNYGHAVAVSDDGTVIAVGAPLGSDSSSGQVFLFRRQAGAWNHVQTIERLVPGESINWFGRALEFHGHSLLAVNPFESTNAGFQSGPPICFYEPDVNGEYPTEPSELLFFPGNHSVAGSLTVRGDVLLVGADRNDGGVVRFDRVERDGEQLWEFVAAFEADDAQPGIASRDGFGYSVAIADDPEVMIVGEPFWTPDIDHWEIGRIHFPGRVFSNSEFEIPEATSWMTVDFDFPGLPLQQLFVQLAGFFDLYHPLNCHGSPIPVQALLENFVITTVEPEHVLEGPFGIPITLSEIQISLSGASDPAPVGAGGSIFLTGMTVHIEAMVQVGKLTPFKFTADGDQTGEMPALIHGGSFGEPVTFAVPNLELDFSPDIGLGENNPVISARGSVLGQGDAPCEADIVVDGTLNFFDIQAFLNAFADQTEPGDWNDDSSYNFFDVQSYLNAYSAGCP